MLCYDFQVLTVWLLSFFWDLIPAELLIPVYYQVFVSRTDIGTNCNRFNINNIKTQHWTYSSTSFIHIPVSWSVSLQPLFMLSLHSVYKVIAFQEAATKILCEYGVIHILAMCLLPPLSTVLLEAVVSRKCWLHVCQTTQCHIPEDDNLYNYYLRIPHLHTFYLWDSFLNILYVTDSLELSIRQFSISTSNKKKRKRIIWLSKILN